MIPEREVGRIYLFISGGRVLEARRIAVDHPSRRALEIRDQEYRGARVAVMLEGENYP